MKYFTIEEMCKSKLATKRGIDNTPSQLVKVNLCCLIKPILDPLREWYGKPITVTSGFRCAALNKAVGGAPISQHLFGEAADITAGSKDENRKLFEYIRKRLPFDQLILEFGGEWVHVSYSQRHRRETLDSYKFKGVTIYRKYYVTNLEDDA